MDGWWWCDVWRGGRVLTRMRMTRNRKGETSAQYLIGVRALVMHKIGHTCLMVSSCYCAVWCIMVKYLYSECYRAASRKILFHDPIDHHLCTNKYYVSLAMST
jgi:hypothetical protein